MIKMLDQDKTNKLYVVKAGDTISELVQKLTQKLNDAIERVKYLDGQVKMLELQKQAATKYSDSDRNY